MLQGREVTQRTKHVGAVDDVVCQRGWTRDVRWNKRMTDGGHEHIDAWQHGDL